MSVGSSPPISLSNKRKREEDEEPEQESVITVIGPLGPSEKHREYKIGDQIELLGLSATVGGPRSVLCFGGQMQCPLWEQIHDIICDIIEEKEEAELKASEERGEPGNPKVEANIKRLESELQRIPEGDFVADVFVFMEHVDGWARYNICGRKYDVFFGVPCADDVKTATRCLHIQLAKPTDVIEQLRAVGPETTSHGLFNIGLERGEDGTGYRDDWEPLVPDN
jgi:hypothetical protein